MCQIHNYLFPPFSVIEAKAKQRKEKLRKYPVTRFRNLMHLYQVMEVVRMMMIQIKRMMLILLLRAGRRPRFLEQQMLRGKSIFLFSGEY